VIFSAALSASCTRQKTMASTFTGTVSRVRACSALKAVVWMRSSITIATRSITGMIQNRPGPLTPCSRPARRITNRCQALAICNDRATMNAARTKGAARTGDSTPRPKPARSRMTTMKSEMGFMGFPPLQAIAAARS